MQPQSKKPQPPKGTTHIHIELSKFSEHDGWDSRMFERWVPIPYKRTSSKVYTWNGSDWVYYLTASKSDKFVKSLRIPLKGVDLFK